MDADRLKDDQSHPTGGPRPVVVQMAPARQVVFAVICGVCGHEDAVSHKGRTERDRAKGMGVTGSRFEHAGLTCVEC